jgi:hypothetical protein
VEVRDENELAEADDDARRAEAAGDRPVERRITTPKVEGISSRPEADIFKQGTTGQEIRLAGENERESDE